MENELDLKFSRVPRNRYCSAAALDSLHHAVKYHYHPFGTKNDSNTIHDNGRKNCHWLMHKATSLSEERLHHGTMSPVLQEGKNQASPSRFFPPSLPTCNEMPAGPECGHFGLSSYSSFFSSCSLMVQLEAPPVTSNYPTFMRHQSPSCKMD